MNVTIGPIQHHESQTVECWCRHCVWWKERAVEEAEKKLLKYGDHTPRCAIRRYPSSNLYGDPVQAGVSCTCGWDEIIKPIVDAAIKKARGT